MANTTIYNLPALNTVDSTSLFPLTSNGTGTPTTFQASIGNIGNAITGNLRMSGDNLTSTNNTINISANSNVWNFSADGVLTLPGNIIAINYANSNRVTGNITFKDEIVIGTGTSNLISGLYLAPSSSSADANMYLRVRGNINDEPTHIHFDTGNNQYYNQFIGDDNKYIQLANTGNIVINSNNGAGNSAQWNFVSDGNLTLPADATISDYNDTVSLNVDGNRFAQLYWNGNIGNGNPDTGGDYYIWAYVGDDGFTVQHENASTSTDNLWKFGIDGNLTLPTGTPSINYANGSPYGGGGGNANTGNVTFDNVNVIGTGNLKLQPDPANSGSYLDIFLTSGPDLHLVASASANLILGKDGDANVMTSWNGNVYIQAWNQNTGAPNIWMFDGTGNLTAPGYIVLDDGTDGNIDSTGNINIISNNNTWLFGTGGNLTFPGSNLVITPSYAAFSNAAVIASTNHNLITFSTGANGGTSSLWVEDYANAGTSNIAAVYANPTPGSRNVRIAVGLNGSPGPNLWDFDATGNTTFPSDGNVNLGNIAIATHANFVLSAFIGNSSANIFLNYDGSGNFTGNLTSANANLGNLATANYVNVSGNITSGNANLGNIAIANYFSTSGTGGDIVLTGGNISGANVLTANVLTANTIQLTTIAIANLPPASTPGLKAFVSDSIVAPLGNFGVIVANGGANYTTVFSNGTNWLIG
jgi:hypothetical protein